MFDSAEESTYHSSWGHNFLLPDVEQRPHKRQKAKCDAHSSNKHCSGTCHCVFDVYMDIGWQRTRTRIQRQNLSKHTARAQELGQGSRITSRRTRRIAQLVNLTDLIVRAKEPRRSSRRRSRRRHTRTSRGGQRRPSSPDLTNLTGRVQGHGLSNTGRVNIHRLVRTTVSHPQPNYSHNKGNRIDRISTPGPKPHSKCWRVQGLVKRQGIGSIAKPLPKSRARPNNNRSTAHRQGL